MPASSSCSTFRIWLSVREEQASNHDHAVLTQKSTTCPVRDTALQCLWHDGHGQVRERSQVYTLPLFDFPCNQAMI